MNLIITKSTEKEVEAFEAQSWSAEDLKHYRREVSWDEWNPTKFIFKAELDNEIAGIIGGNITVGVTFIERIIVSESFRKMGIGKQLIQKVEDYAKELNSHKIYLYTGKDWSSNKFYEQIGFKNTGELENHYLNVDFVIYTKFLK
ncbi:GNAT family N-acetyltransferase [Candidatus Woesebacteria bacterium]|nr:GNAT family N-acetyltransferase [Candidatus Woesebacteria bacterium]